MESMIIMLRLASLLSTLALPLLLGVLVYYRLRKYQDFLAHAAGFVAALVLTFHFLRMEMINDLMRSAPKGGPVCGLPILGAIAIILIGTSAQFVLSMMTQFGLHFRHLSVEAAREAELRRMSSD